MMLVAYMDDAIQEGAGGQNNSLSGNLNIARQFHTVNLVVPQQKADDFTRKNIKVLRPPHSVLYCKSVQLTVSLDSRTLYCRAFAAVQKAILDARQISRPCHYAIQGINLAHQMAFSQATDGRVAGHDPDLVLIQADEKCLNTHTRSSGSRFHACMSPADNDD